MSTVWEQAMTDWTAEMQAMGRAPRTIETKLRWLRLFAAATDADPVDVSRSDVVAWLAGNTHWRPATRHGAFGALTQFFAWMAATGRRGGDPTDGVAVGRVPTYLPRPVDEALFRSRLCDPSLSESQRLALLLMGTAGLRRDECVRVHSDDLDSAGLWVVGKGGHRRLIPITGELREAIEARGAGFVFPARFKEGEHMHVDALGKMVRRAFGGAVGPHRLRHRFATAAYRGTHDLRAVQTLLGHRSLNTTQVYVAVSGEDLVAAMEAAA